MRGRWTWFLAGWLLLVGLVGCGKPVSSVSTETAPTARSDTPVGEVAASTAVAEPASTPETESSPPGTGPGEKATPAVMGTAVLILPTQVIQEETVTISPTIPSPSDPALQGLVMQAKQDLARRLSIEVDQIQLIETEAVVWPDASLGCPQPGMRYRQVPMDGARILLVVEGRVYAYHSGGGRDPFLCEQPAKTVPGSDGALPPPGRADE